MSDTSFCLHPHDRRTILVDGAAVEIERGGRDHHGFERFFVMGRDTTGRRCRVSHHSIPAATFTHGGRVRTSGHLYEVARPTRV